MKNIIYGLAMLALMSVFAVSCKDYDEFQIKGEPYFSAALSSETVIDMNNASRYQLDLESYAYSVSADKSNHILKASIFTVSSNMRWKIEPSDNAEYDWVTPFPAEGEAEGNFLFKVSRNTAQASTRDAYFNILVDKGNGFVPIDGLLVVHQQSSADFLELGAAKFEQQAAESTCKLTVFSNVDWTYTLTPNSDYATSDVSWIEDANKHVVEKHIDTLTFRIAENPGGFRGANIAVKYKLNGEDFESVVPISQFGASEVVVEGFPVIWNISGLAATDITYGSSFASSGTMAASTGSGTASFVELESNNTSAFTRVVGGTFEPYVTGTWPGDYWEFKSDAPISSGTIVNIQFSCRVSGAGYKYWRLEYRDGDEWKTLGGVKETTFNGAEVKYTHTMEAGGSINTKVTGTFKVDNTTDAADVRFVIVSNETCSGTFPDAPNGNTARLSNRTGDDLDVNPTFTIVSAGTEVLVQANVEISGLSNNVITFEGEPEGGKTFSVKSDNDFTVTPSASWIQVTPQSGLAGDEAVPVTVTCDKSILAVSRTAVITVKSGITSKIITVVQSAAGGELDPLISIVGGNTKSIIGEKGSLDVSVQANVPVSVKTDADWLEETVTPASKSLVEVSGHVFSYTPNLTGSERVGHIIFFNSDYNLSSVLEVTQAEFAPAITVYPARSMNFSGETYVGKVVTNVAFNLSSDAGWLVPVTSEYDKASTTFSVKAAENTTESTRYATLTFTNTDYSVSTTLSVAQNAAGVFFFDDFSWLKPWADASGSGDSVGDSNASAKAQNVYNAGFESFLATFASFGYSVTNEAAQIVYLQTYYLKFNKTSNDTDLILPACAFGSTPIDVTLTFDWCAHLTGSGSVDDVALTIELSGAGTCKDTGAAESNKITTTQTKKVFAWQHASVTLQGVTDKTVIKIKTNYNTNASSTQHRWHVDNIKIAR